MSCHAHEHGYSMVRLDFFILTGNHRVSMADTPSRGAVEEMISFYSRFDPATYLSDLESACRRQDGRSHKQLRPLKLLQGILQKSTAGSSLAKIGETKVLAGVSLQVGQPGEDSPEKGEIGEFGTRMTK